MNESNDHDQQTDKNHLEQNQRLASAGRLRANPAAFWGKGFRNGMRQDR